MRVIRQIKIFLDGTRYVLIFVITSDTNDITIIEKDNICRQVESKEAQKERII